MQAFAVPCRVSTRHSRRISIYAEADSISGVCPFIFRGDWIISVHVHQAPLAGHLNRECAAVDAVWIIGIDHVSDLYGSAIENRSGAVEITPVVGGRHTAGRRRGGSRRIGGKHTATRRQRQIGRR